MKELRVDEASLKNTDYEYMLFVGQDSVVELKEVMTYLDELGVTFFGGIYPKLITNNQIVSKGYIVKPVKPIYSEMVYPFIMKKIPELDASKQYTGFLTGDGFSQQNGDLIVTIQSKVKGNINYVGGGSAIYFNELGIHKIEQDKVIFNNKGFFKDAMHLCIVEQSSETNINLGWSIIDGPFEITKAENNLIKKMNDENAFEFYKGILESNENKSIFNKEDSLFYASMYAFGIVENGIVKNVRMPIEITQEGYIRVVNEVNESMPIYLLKANKTNMLESYKKNFNSHNKLDSVFMVSCLTRDIYLDMDFENEVSFVSQALKMPVEGIITVGEFCNSADSNQLAIYEGASIISVFE
ncbi:FIST C-terminal domain-containing protein [Paenibacillus polymyxa]|uniref:FIST C-terminal domain-containing protein n=1 Tax=Paenibacillus polymyxa TaxID=1406 RepID=UPI00234A8C93|nr:FIST C-terminal domain-containing protein [Paenibacillus polymyxa]WCM60724.1 FIST C-terminal domain-containing protein [Paenibacillus polymyxa]